MRANAVLPIVGWPLCGARDAFVHQEVVSRGVGLRVSRNGTWRGEPNLSGIACACDVCQRATQVVQPIGLPDDVGVQRNAHDQGLALGLLKHFVKVVDDHVCKVFGIHLTRHDHWDVVDFLGVGHGQQTVPTACAHARDLVVVAPVQGVAIACLCQQVGRVQTF